MKVRLGNFAILIGVALSVAVGSVQASMKEGLSLWEQGNQTDAVAVWEPLAQAGDPEAALFLGFAYRTGRGVEQNPDKAFHWYRKAAELGMPEAQIELSLMYELGLGTEPDPAEAASWYSLATREDFCPSDLPAGGRLGHK